MARVPDGGPAEMLWILGRHAGLVGNDLSPIGTGVGDLNSTSANAAPFPFMMSSTVRSALMSRGPRRAKVSSASPSIPAMWATHRRGQPPPVLAAEHESGIGASRHGTDCSSDHCDHCGGRAKRVMILGPAAANATLMALNACARGHEPLWVELHETDSRPQILGSSAAWARPIASVARDRAGRNRL